MHIPNESIYTPYPTREQHLRRAIKLLKEKVADYMRRECELGTPRAEVQELITIIADEIEYDSDNRSVLYLAVEDLSLAHRRPETLDVDPDDDDPPWAEYLIRMNFEEWIMKQLHCYIEEHPLCCEVCGHEPATWFWFPHANEPASNSELLVGSQRWGIGETCKAKLNHELGLPYQVGTRVQYSASICLLPIEPEQQEAPSEPEGQTAIGSVPSNYQTLTQRVAQATKLFDGWLDYVVEHVLGRLPDPQDVNRAITSITYKVIPKFFKEPLHLVLLAIEEPTLATQQLTYYGELVEANSDIFATQLLCYAVIDHVAGTLHQRWQERQNNG